MSESECAGVKRLSRAKVEAVVDELFVFLCGQSFEYFRTTVFLVIEKRMSEALHVNAYLVCASCFEPTFD